MAKESRFEFTISALDRFSRTFESFNARVDRALGPVRRLRSEVGQLDKESGLGRLTESLGQVRDRFGRVASEAGMAAGKIAAAMGLAGLLITNQLIAPASAFEDLRGVLETLYEGDAAKAGRALDWVSEFAAKTPYEVQGVTDAFVQLSSYGLEPMDGLLRTIGDTAAAMKKPLAQAVDAIADAVTGENERLKEFGIKASKQGKYIVYEYTKNGQTMRKAALANNRAMIQHVISGIWNEKYAGAMERMSKGWSGMLSNLADWWTRFRLMIMDAGLFDWLKDKLGGALERINALADSGELQALAEVIGQKLVAGFEAAWLGMQKFWAGLQGVWEVIGPVVDALGPANVAIAALAGVIFGPLLAAIAALIPALVSLGAAILTTPIGWIALAVAGVAAAIWKYWEPISGFFDGVSEVWRNSMAQVRADFDKLASWLSGAVDKLVGMLPDWLKGSLGLSGYVYGRADEAQADQNAFYTQRKLLGQPAGAAAVSRSIREQRSFARTESVVRQDSKITLEIPNLPKGSRVRREGDAPVDLDLGWAMGG